MKSALSFSMFVCMFVLSVPAVHGDEAAYTEAGMPPLNESWTGKEFAIAVEVIKSKKVPLPVLSDATGLKFFQRLINDENFAHLSDKSIWLQTRFKSGMSMGMTLSELYMHYHSETALDESAKAEMAMIRAMVLKVNLYSYILSTETRPPKEGDRNYESRMADLKAMEEQRLKSYVSMIDLVGELPLPNEIAEEFVLKALENHTEQLLTVLTQDIRDSSKVKLEEVTKAVKPAQQERIKKIIDKLSKNE